MSPHGKHYLGERGRIGKTEETMTMDEASGRWRVGRTLGRTLYKDDVCIGMVDTPELATEIVIALNDLARARETTALLQKRCQEALQHVESARPALKWVRNHAPRHDDHDQAHAQLALDHVLQAVDVLRGYSVVKG